MSREEWHDPLKATEAAMTYLGCIPLDHVPDTEYDGLARTSLNSPEGAQLPVGVCERCGSLVRWQVEARRFHRSLCKSRKERRR